MAVRIPIITVFDSKGLKQAQYQLNKVRGNFQALGRNAAIAGVGIGVVAAALGKSVQNAAEAQRVMSQTEAVLRSTGTTANGTAADIANLSETLSRQTAVDDELIQSGANLLLTFKNIQNQSGLNNDIFNQTVQATLDVSRAMGTDASTEAIRLGKALNDPVKGLSALSRVGIQFTAQQKEQIKALTESGDLLGAQKIILAELQSQFGGSAQAYAQTFAGQIELLGIELENFSEEIGVIVMPALRSLMDGLREMAPEIGSKLRDAVNSVDWKALAKALLDTATFFLQNAEVIVKVSSALFILNTAYNLIKVTQGIYNAVAVITNATLGGTDVAAKKATISLGFLRTALLLSGIGAAVVALGFIIDGISKTNEGARATTPTVTSFGTAVLKSGQDAEWAAGKYGVAKSAIEGLNSAAANYKPPVLSVGPDAAERRMNLDKDFNLSRYLNIQAELEKETNKTPSAASPAVARTTFAGALSKNLLEQTRLTKLQAKGLTEGAASLALSTITNKTQFKKLEANLSKAGVVDKRQAVFNRTAAGKAEIAQIKANNEAINAQIKADQDEADRLRDQRLAAEKAAADERERIYKSFADSVTSTFASIKDSIVGAFSLPELGGSTDSIIRNMDKLLARVKSFSANITKLSSMGLDPALLQQVIQAGPVAGARLAAGLVAGGADALGRINAGFGEIQTLGSELGMTGTQSRFNNQTQQNIYNINVEGGVGSGATIGKAIVDAIKAYERTSGAVWQGA
jgi:cell division protein FtsB